MSELTVLAPPVAHDPGARRGTRPVGIVGAGRLAQAVADRLGTDARGEDLGRFEDLGAVVVVPDGLDLGDHAAVRERCATAGIPWLPVRIEFGRAIVGPAERAGVAGCVACAEVRAAAAQPDPSVRA